MRWLERGFEGVLWNTRWLVLLAVFGSLLASVAIFYVATVDAVLTVGHLLPYADPKLDPAAREALRGVTVRHVVAIVDGYLLASVLLIFALGLYEIFISRIDWATESELAPNVLIIRNLDDLKSRLGKVILLILVVSFSEQVLSMRLEKPLDLLWAAAGIGLVALALFLARASEKEPRAGKG